MRQTFRALGLCILAGSAMAEEFSPSAERFCETEPCYTDTNARFEEPVTRYDHGVLGDAIEWGSLSYTSPTGQAHVKLNADAVFEDLAPRLADLDGDGVPEVVVVESDAGKGAQLAIYAPKGERLVKVAATPHIGTRYRWLAPVGIADLDGDGSVELAYVDRPHLARILRIWSYRDGSLVEIASIGGLTNHRIGEDFISGGLRRCKGRVELVTADAGWRQIIATWFDAGAWASRVVAKRAQQADFARVLGCR